MDKEKQSQRLKEATKAYMSIKEYNLDELAHEEMRMLKEDINIYVKDPSYKKSGIIKLPHLEKVLIYTFSPYKPMVIKLEHRHPGYFQ